MAPDPVKLRLRLDNVPARGPVGRPSAVGVPRTEQRGYRLSEVDAFDVCCGSDVWEAKHAE